jgi:hypothetical protein
MTTAQVSPAAAELAAAVEAAEYQRLLGLPRGRTLDGELAERAGAARRFYAERGDPFVAARRIELIDAGSEHVTTGEGLRFEGRALAERVRNGGVHALVALAVSAGAAAEAEARRLWAEEKPDESFFVDRFATAIVEQLVRWASVWACREAERRGETALFHLSPGCGGWDFGDQPRLFGLLAGDARRLGPLTLLESGMLTPTNSMLAVLALTRRAVAPSPKDACRSCDLAPCAFRRAPFGGRA